MPTEKLKVIKTGDRVSGCADCVKIERKLVYSKNECARLKEQNSWLREQLRREKELKHVFYKAYAGKVKTEIMERIFGGDNANNTD